MASFECQERCGADHRTENPFIDGTNVSFGDPSPRQDTTSDAVSPRDRAPHYSTSLLKKRGIRREARNADYPGSSIVEQSEKVAAA
jgi:hypothetical protein